MPNTIGKNLHLCFTALKRELPSSNTNPSSPTHHNSPSPSPSPSPSTVLVKTFNSLYDSTTTSKSLSHRTTTSSDDYFSTSDFSDTDGGPSAPSPPDFATVFASQRFFFSSPGRSNSIIDTPPPDSHTLVAGGVPISTYSPDPYSDFRRSMQEMVDAHSLSDVASDWDFLHELLLCYLELNPKYAHKFIIGAFADLLVSLTNSSPPDGVFRKPDISDRCTASLCHLNSHTHKD